MDNKSSAVCTKFNFIQWGCTNDKGIGRPCIINSAILCAQGKPCVVRIIHPHATLSTPIFWAIYVFFNTIFIAFLDIIHLNSLKISSLKLCCTNIKLFSKDPLILICCNSIRELIIFHDKSKSHWEDPRYLFSFACVLSTLEQKYIDILD